MTDESILEFSGAIAAVKVPEIEEKPKPKKKKIEPPKKLEKLPEVDEYSAMLMYTQSVHDSYSGNKNKTVEEVQAKQLIEKFEQEHPEEKVALPNVTQPEKNDYRTVEVKNKTKEVDPFVQQMSQVDMADPQDVIHAAIAEMQHEEVESKKPKKKPAPKPVGKMWENLAYLELQQDKISKDEKNFLPPEEKEEKPPEVNEE